MSRKNKLLILLIVFFAIHFSLSFGYKSIMSKSQMLQTDIQYEKLAKGEELNTLIMGNSHSFALQTDLFKNAFNFASYGEPIELTYYKLSHVLTKKEIKVDTLILPLDLGDLVKVKMDNSKYPYYWNKYIHFSDYYNFTDSKWSFTKNTFLGYCFPYVNGSNDVFDYFFSDASAEQVREGKGVIPDSLVQVNREFSSDALKEQFHKLNFLKKSIELCREHNVQLVFVRFPVTKSYYYQKSKYFNPSEYYEILENKLIEIDSLVIIVNQSQKYSFDQFRDPHHLKGGEIRKEFTKEVLKLIK